LLRALGIAADGRVSSSMAENAHASKTALVDRAMQHLDLDAVTQDPLAAVATLGDPMQATVAGLASGCLDADTPLLLAGGTQMIAVLALLRRLATLQRAPDPSGRIAVATTRWVVEDPRADAIGLQREVGPDPLLATALSFAHARHAGLRRYEEGLVKEGVGAGGAAIAAALCADVRCRELLACVESIAARLGIPE
jgi:NaMN:DMB phosphoribosyltransferase